MQLHSHIDRGVLRLGMENPPVNCLSLPLRTQLFAALRTEAANPAVHAVILYGLGNYFCAGGDLREMGTPAADATPRLSADILPAIESCPKPVIAAVHGAAIGGGFEMALACHYRIARADARIALPELKHGIIPLSGSLRLPRAWGVAPALGMMLDSTPSTAQTFAGTRVFDQLIESGNVLAAAMEFAQARAAGNSDPASLSALLIRNRPPADANPGAELAAALALYGPERLSATQWALVSAVRGGIECHGFDQAIARAQQIFDELSQLARAR